MEVALRNSRSVRFVVRRQSQSAVALLVNRVHPPESIECSL